MVDMDNVSKDCNTMALAGRRCKIRLAGEFVWHRDISENLFDGLAMIWASHQTRLPGGDCLFLFRAG